MLSQSPQRPCKSRALEGSKCLTRLYRQQTAVDFHRASTLPCTKRAGKWQGPGIPPSPAPTICVGPPPPANVCDSLFSTPANVCITSHNNMLKEREKNVLLSNNPYHHMLKEPELERLKGVDILPLFGLLGLPALEAPSGFLSSPSQFCSHWYGWTKNEHNYCQCWPLLTYAHDNKDQCYRLKDTLVLYWWSHLPWQIISTENPTQEHSLPTPNG